MAVCRYWSVAVLKVEGNSGNGNAWRGNILAIDGNRNGITIIDFKGNGTHRKYSN
jgi:hypothetical protein